MEERTIEREYDEPQYRQEQGVEIPYERIDPKTLRDLIGEFVTREWEELGDAPFTLENKIDQVHRQLTEKKVVVVFDLSSNTANIVVRK